MSASWQTVFLSFICSLFLPGIRFTITECLLASPKPFLLPLTNYTIPPDSNNPNGVDS